MKDKKQTFQEFLESLTPQQRAVWVRYDNDKKQDENNNN